MKRRAQFVFAVLPLAAMTLACDRKREAAIAPPSPATHPVETNAPPATRPAARPVSLVTINDQVFTFPPAKLVFQQSATGITATLFSDDPPEAVKDDYRGNSYRFEVAFDALSPDEISGQTFAWKNSADDKRDSLTGIFLNGQRQTVQPLNATLTLQRVGQQWTANIGGEFQYTDNQAADPAPVTIHAFADMTAELAAAASKP